MISKIPKPGLIKLASFTEIKLTLTVAKVQYGRNEKKEQKRQNYFEVDYLHMAKKKYNFTSEVKPKNLLHKQ